MGCCRMCSRNRDIGVLAFGDGEVANEAGAGGRGWRICSNPAGTPDMLLPPRLGDLALECEVVEFVDVGELLILSTEDSSDI